MSVECSVMVREVRGSYDWSQCKLFRRLASITGLVLSGGSYRSQLCWASFSYYVMNAGRLAAW